MPDEGFPGRPPAPETASPQPPFAAPSRRADRFAVALMAVLAAIAIGPGLLPGRTPLPLDILGLFEPWRLEWPAPENPVLGDPVMEFSARVAVAKAWRGGHLPLWNPAVMSGHPLVGDSITAPFYPLQVLPALLLDDQRALALQVFLQLWLAGVFMYAWLRRLLGHRGRDPESVAVTADTTFIPALAGAITWQLALYQQVWLAYPYFLGTLAWLPLIAYGWETYAQTGRRRALAAGSLGLGLAILGGQLQFVVYGGLVLGLYGLARILEFRPPRPLPQPYENPWPLYDQEAEERSPEVLADDEEQSASEEPDSASDEPGGPDGRPTTLGDPAATRLDADEANVDEWGRPRFVGRGVVGALVIAALGLALGAVTWVPALDQLGDLARPVLTPDAFGQTGIGLASLLRLADPQNSGLSGGAKNEQAIYLGFIPLLVLLFLPFLLRDRRVRVALVLCLLVFAIAAGTPLGQALAFVPVLGQFGLMRWLAMWPLVVGLAVAVGLEAIARFRLSPDPGPRFGGWLQGRGPLLPWIALWVGLPLVPVAAPLALSLSDRSLVPLVPISLIYLVSWLALVRFVQRPASLPSQVFLVATLCLDLLAAGWHYTPDAPLEEAFSPLPPLDQIVAERAREPFRVAVVQRGPIALGPAVAPSLGLDEIGGYSSVVRQSYRNFLGALTAPPDNDILRMNTNMVTLGDLHPVLPQLLNIRYLMSAEGLAPRTVQLLAPDEDPTCRQVAVLVPGLTISRTFTASADGFNHLDLPVFGDRPVTMRVWSIAGPGSGPRLVDERELLDAGGTVYLPSDGQARQRFIDDGRIPGNRTVYFARETHSAAKTYRVEVSSPVTPTLPSTAEAPASHGDGEVTDESAVCSNSKGLVMVAWADQEYPHVAAENGLVVQRPIRPPLGRAWWVGEADTAFDQSSALGLVRADDFDPARTVIVEGGPIPAAPDVSTAEGASASAAPGGRVLSVTDEGPNALRVLVEAPSGGWLVLAEAYAPGWEATVDGRPAELRRADGGIRAVALPAGAKTVFLAYWPTSLAWGMGFSVAAILVLLAMAVLAGLPTFPSLASFSLSATRAPWRRIWPARRASFVSGMSVRWSSALTSASSAFWPGSRASSLGRLARSWSFRAWVTLLTASARCSIRTTRSPCPPIPSLAKWSSSSGC